jgi:hypothetical protein
MISGLMTRRTAAVVVVLIALVELFVPWREPGADRQVASRDPSEAASSTAPDAISRNDPRPRTSAVAWASDPRAEAIAAMRDAASRAPDLRAYFEDALKRPRDGGVYYAARVWTECASLTAIRKSPHAKVLKSGTEETLASSRDRLERDGQRCHDLGDDRSKTMLDEALRSHASADDPLETIGVRTRDADRQADFDVADATVRQAIALGDPNGFRDAVRRLNGLAAGFDTLDLNANPDLRWLLAIVSDEARCELGADCAADASAVRACYAAGECGPYLERIGAQADFTDDERLFVVEAAGSLAASARDGSLLGRYRK